MLVILSIVIAEILTGSTPVIALIDPFQLAGLLGFYGCGVLIIRDVSVRWDRGWSAVIPLGLAYGIVEEGFGTQTMTDPYAHAAGFLGGYGHFLGINAVFAVVIDIFHAIFSIALPILLIRLAYPEKRRERFLTEKGFLWAIELLTLSALAGFFLFNIGFFAPPADNIFFLVCIVLLGLVAYRAPLSWIRPSESRPKKSPRWFMGVGALFSWGWLLFYIWAPHIFAAPVIPIAAEIAIAAICLYLIRENVGLSGNGEQLVYLAFGLLSWYTFWAVIVTFLLADFLVVAFLLGVFYYVYRLKVKVHD